MYRVAAEKLRDKTQEAIAVLQTRWLGISATVNRKVNRSPIRRTAGD